MNQEYDILNGLICPTFSTKKLETKPGWAAYQSAFKTLRVNIVEDCAVSLVSTFETINGEETEIFLQGSAEKGNGIPQHFTAVRNNYAEYAKALGVKHLRITLENRSQGIDFLLAKFPLWTPIDHFSGLPSIRSPQ